MNVRRILCRLGLHAPSEWQFIEACARESDHIHQLRLCERCGRRQHLVTDKSTHKHTTFWGAQ